MEIARFFSGLALYGGGWAVHAGGRPATAERIRQKEFAGPFRNKIEYPRTLYFTYGSPDRIRVRPCRVDTIP
jgi:hypothetical protein